MDGSSSDGSSSFLDRVRSACRRKGYTYRTEKTYLRWIVRYVKYHDTEHPRTSGKPEVREYLSYLATDRNVAASTQNQALNALLFLYRGCARGRVGTGLTYKITVKKSSHIVVVPARLFASPLDAGVCL